MYLSTFIGNTRPGMNRTVSNSTETDFVFRTISSTLKFYINGQLFNGTSMFLDSTGAFATTGPITIQTPVNSTVFDDPQINFTSTEVNYSNLIKDSYKFTDNLDMSTFNITTWTAIPYLMANRSFVNEYINAFEDLYPNSL